MCVLSIIDCLRYCSRHWTSPSSLRIWQTIYENCEKVNSFVVQVLFGGESWFDPALAGAGVSEPYWQTPWACYKMSVWKKTKEGKEMIPSLTTIILAFAWLLYESDFMRIRLITGPLAKHSSKWARGAINHLNELRTLRIVPDVEYCYCDNRVGSWRALPNGETVFIHQ